MRKNGGRMTTDSELAEDTQMSAGVCQRVAVSAVVATLWDTVVNGDVREMVVGR